MNSHPSAFIAAPAFPSCLRGPLFLLLIRGVITTEPR